LNNEEMADVAIDSAYSTRKRTHNTSKDETDSIENDRSRSKRQSTNNSTTGKKKKLFWVHWFPFFVEM